MLAVGTVMGLAYPGESDDDVVVRCFGSETAMRETWQAHRMTLMADFRRSYGSGRRPWAWWRFESGFEPKPFPEGYRGQDSPVDETAWLLEHGRMTAAERVDLDVQHGLRRQLVDAEPSA